MGSRRVSLSRGGVGDARRTRARWIGRNRRRGVNAYRWNGLEALDETHRRRRGVLAVHACPSGAVVLQFSLDPADSSAAWPRLSSARLAFFARSRRVSAPLRPARTGDEPVRTPRRARRQAKRVLQGDGGFPQGCDARRAAIVTVPTISVPVNDRFVPWNACSDHPRPFPDHETTPNRDSFTQRHWRRAARPGEPWTASSPPARSEPRRPNDEAGQTIRVTRAEWWRRRLADEPTGTSRPRRIGSRVYAPRKRSRRPIRGRRSRGPAGVSRGDATTTRRNNDCRGGEFLFNYFHTGN